MFFGHEDIKEKMFPLVKWFNSTFLNKTSPPGRVPTLLSVQQMEHDHQGSGVNQGEFKMSNSSLNISESPQPVVMKSRGIFSVFLVLLLAAFTEVRTAEV